MYSTSTLKLNTGAAVWLSLLRQRSGNPRSAAKHTCYFFRLDFWARQAIP